VVVDVCLRIVSGGMNDVEPACPKLAALDRRQVLS
jgi:hypothetical protein